MESARLMSDLGNRQLDFAKQQYSDLNPIMQGIGNAQLAGMQQQQAIAADNKAFLDSSIRPLQQGLINDANTFNTSAYRDQLANQAAADAGHAFGQTRQANERASRSMGVNPNSGAAQALNAQAGLGLAAVRGGAMNNARNQARDTGYARRMQAVNMGMGIGQQALSAYQGSAASGASAGGAFAAPGNQYLAGVGQGIGTIGRGQSMMLNSLGNTLNAQASFAGQSNAGLGGAIGAGIGFYASDRRLKENIKLFRRDPRTGLNVYHFQYKGDPDSRTFEGVMADEVQPYNPNAVVTDDMGYMSVNYELLGITLKEVV